MSDVDDGPNDREFLCLRCGETSTVDMNHLPPGCPRCGTTSIPADLTTDMVSIDITWHELRILVMWSEFHAGKQPGEDDRYTMQRVVSGIADRIHRQHLDKRPLTFTGEIAELAGDPSIGKVEVHGINLLPPDPDA